MNLPEGFPLSQSSLQDFIDCPRRFQLRHLLRLAWPAVRSEPVLELERYQQLGEQIHRMIQQHLLGVPVERLSPMAQDAELARWWENYLRFSQEKQGLPRITGANARFYPEISISAPLAGCRLIAKMDLVVLSAEGRALLIDWKTSRKRPRRTWLEKRAQTRLYPYLLVKAGAFLNHDTEIEPERVEMLYWFTTFPDQPERFAYNPTAFQADQEFLEETIAAIQALDEASFPLTSDIRHCAFCVYRSLCDRGFKAGFFTETEASPEDEQDFDLPEEFEQIAEIGF